MIYAQARQGDFPVIFAKLHPQFATPSKALISLFPVFSITLLFNGFFNPDLGTLLKWPSVIFIAAYIIAMASAVKLIDKKTDLTWWLAIIALVISSIIYGFSGIACIYPFILAGLDWLFSSDTRQQHKLTKQFKGFCCKK